MNNIPPEGSLALLAYGHIGYKLWKQKQQEVGYTNKNHIFIKMKKLPSEPCPQDKK